MPFKIKRICDILDEINKPELGNEKDKEHRLQLVDELDMLIEGPENARGIFMILFKFNT